jgi:hypothetical protein
MITPSGIPSLKKGDVKMADKKDAEGRVLEEKEKYEKPDLKNVERPKGKTIAASGCEHPHEGAKERCIEW